ncbi:U3 snoRNP protein/Ribosome production factor 1 like protein [Aduncisulcus paluster]|uniref:U3 snoRNP protein/Ribosome production factor 1 like protein n=1 Tax=Aduncisulcus paluster TaxID=2918883 RepID=A0ABQ5JSL4_9EUKA|nr:U3 snoRNP protein/Ribosome production factor 1 like protein [Aduncisulcus paluster]
MHSLVAQRARRKQRELIVQKKLSEQKRGEDRKKKKVLRLLKDGKKILSKKLQDQALDLYDKATYDDVITGKISSKTAVLAESEYATAGLKDPKILITTSRHPSTRLSLFAKELRIIFPNSQRVNRGSLVMESIVSSATSSGFSDIVIAHETKGQPDALFISHLPAGPTLCCSLTGVVLRHDLEGLKPCSEKYPHLLLSGFSSSIGMRIKSILKFCFPQPPSESHRLISFVNEDDLISFRHHTFKREKGTDPKGVETEECGPRFEMRPYQIRKGTVDQKDPIIEWSLHLFMNTAGKKKIF